LAVVSFVVLAAGVVWPDRWPAARDARVAPIAAAIGLAVQVIALFVARPALYLSYRPDRFLPFQLLLVVLAAAAFALLWAGRRPVASVTAVGLSLALLVGAHFALGMWIIRHSPVPRIDVFVFNTDSVAAFRAGVNPYAITFPNIYSDQGFYAPGVVSGGRLQFGFPYFPLSLLLVIPGRILAGDVRYSQLVALEVAALLMAFSRRDGFGGFGGFAAALYLTTPRTFFVLEQSWTEPFLVAGAAAVVVAADLRFRRLLPWLFGAFLALKQYLVFAAPAALLIVGTPIDWRRTIGFALKACAVAVAIMLPFVLWNPRAFWWSVVELQFHQPFRAESLSLLAVWARLGLGQPSALIAFAAAGVAAALSVRALPRSGAGFAAALACAFFAFFLFNKQAFCNYYFFVLGTLCVALAATPHRGRTPA
jgi:hypothetical protein